MPCSYFVLLTTTSYKGAKQPGYHPYARAKICQHQRDDKIFLHFSRHRATQEHLSDNFTMAVKYIQVVLVLCVLLASILHLFFTTHVLDPPHSSLNPPYSPTTSEHQTLLALNTTLTKLRSELRSIQTAPQRIEIKAPEKNPAQEVI